MQNFQHFSFLVTFFSSLQYMFSSFSSSEYHAVSIAASDICELLFFKIKLLKDVLDSMLPV